MSAFLDPFRLAFGTLSRVPVKPPTTVDRAVAGRAMALSPLVGAVLAAVVAVPLGLVAESGQGSPLLLAALAIAALAFLTRAMHLDGLADVADGLGSGRSGIEAVAIMKKSDIGPFGVATLLLVLLLQVSALAHCVTGGFGAEALALALLWSRMNVTTLSGRLPAAPGSGLGSMVAGTVRDTQALLAFAATFAASLAILWVATWRTGQVWDPSWPHLIATVLGFVAASMAGVALARRVVRRLGGITGDVYGAAIETTFTAVLVVLALAV